MCLAVPGRILSVDGTSASVDFAGVKMAVLLDLLPDAKVGEYVLVHAGFAIQRLNAEDALEIINELKDIDKAIRGGDRAGDIIVGRGQE